MLLKNKRKEILVEDLLYILEEYNQKMPVVVQEISFLKEAGEVENRFWEVDSIYEKEVVYVKNDGSISKKTCLVIHA